MNANYSYNTQKYLQCYNQILSDMMNDMTHATLLSSLSMTFINQMIPHHYASIQFSKNLLLYTTHTELQNIAYQLINTQSIVIKDMMNIYNTCTNQNIQKQINGYLGAYEQITTTMFSSMKKAEPSNDINLSFINQMIPLHYGTIQISQNLLEYPINKELKSIINTMISTQKQVLRQLKSLLQKINSTKY